MKVLPLLETFRALAQGGKDDKGGQAGVQQPGGDGPKQPDAPAPQEKPAPEEEQPEQGKPQFTLATLPPMPLMRMATAHAPTGGVTIAGTHFVGDEFIPGDVLAKATPEEKARRSRRQAGRGRRKHQ